MMLDYLIDLVGRLGHYGYLIIFLASALECSAFLGLVIPGESLVLIGGFFAALGLLDLEDVILVVSVGAIVGDSIGYELGRRLGPTWLLHYGRWVGLRQTHIDRVEAFFERHGGKTIFIGRFIGFLRALAPFIAGSSRMRYSRFLFYNAVGAILWSITFVLLGHFVGASWQIAERWIGRASAILAGIILLLFTLSWLWRWLVRHEADVKRRWQAFLVHPRILALRQRFAPQLEFLQARLSPEGYLGVHLTIGTLILIGATWLFGGIAEDVVTGDPLTAIDKQVAAWFYDRTTPALTTVMHAITSLGSGPVISAITLLTCVLLMWWRYWYQLLALALTVPGGMLLNLLLKDAFARQRPTFENPIMTLTSYSFPSGHTMAATLLYGALSVLAFLTLQTWRWRVLAVLMAWLVILLVGLSRIYLGAHYLSDVLAAIVVGVAWLALCLTAVDTLRQRRLARQSLESKK